VNRYSKKIEILFNLDPDTRPWWQREGLENEDQMRCPWCKGIAEAPFEPMDYGGKAQMGPYGCFECDASQIHPYDLNNENLICTKEERQTGWWKGNK